MTWLDRLPRPGRGRSTEDDERTFAALVDRAFEPDPAAIERVRALVLAHDVAPARPVLAPARSRLGLVRLGLPLAAAFAVVALVGLATLNGSGDRSPTSSPSADQAATLSADLARSATRLHDTTVATGTGDPATITAALTAYRAGLLDLESDLLLPGADIGAVASGLGSQAVELSGLASSMPAADVALYHDVAADLDRIISSLPGASHPGNTDHPTPSDHPGNTDHPNPSNHPGNTDHPTPSDHPGNKNHPTPHPKPTGKGNS